ncbi:transporter [Paucibacter sp. APW11]|uniref:Transporter n=1 Tax=Roseateles aquae TaxID=3077235 RepID=A0ABU3P8I9_9BURK|nr:transporter [Paucibacter sp. APW11]MDT8998892.1 transporter [Paucibacter sp. APW11]
MSIVSPLRLCLVLLAVSGQAASAEDGIVTDRPDFVESSDVVGAGRVQIETSLAWERNSRDGVSTRLRCTPTLLRLGVSENWELRLETDGALALRTTANGQTQRDTGMADVSLGAKWHWQDGDEETGKPGMGWLFHIDVESGSAAFRGQGLRPSARFVAEWDLPGGMSLGVMPGLVWDRNEEGKRFVGGILAAVLGKQLNENLRGFVELSAQQIASTRNGGNVLSFDAGLAYLLNPGMQLDLAISRGLNKNTPDLQWTVGYSVKF